MCLAEAEKRGEAGFGPADLTELSEDRTGGGVTHQLLHQWGAVQDRVPDRLQSARRVMEDLPEGVGVLGLSDGVRLAGGLEGVECLADGGVVAQVHPCQAAADEIAVLGARATDELLADTDLVLLDIKSFDVRTYRRLTGGDLSPTLNFATRLDRLGIPVWIRYVLVPGWTDDPAAADGLGAFLAGLGNVDRVDVLPFHKLGAHKYDALGITFPLRDTPTPDPDLTERVREQFREHGLRAL
ncbi:pyruvate formate-lyase 1-activating enzyme [Streptomyces sp. NBC_00019]|uniref:pyruvate formate-lyase 1-activating enzyme n=1 Tax=Streptomyces sp. NBC_00019 TaxID=2975623 RepID=UPI003244B9BD